MTPTTDDREREFGIEELFFSTTDRKGHISAGNSVFTRVSGYAEEELLGKAHNIIRHPDMPRAVFQLLWDTIGAGNPIAAYVKNRAKDGRPYWVMAVVVPVNDGYLSVRLKPSSPLFAAVKPMYVTLRKLEEEVEAREGRKRSIEVSMQRLGELLLEAGFADYKAFMCAALPAEVRSREAALSANRGVQPNGRVAHAEASSAKVDEFLDSCSFLFGYLHSLFQSLSNYSEANERLRAKSAFVLDLAAEIQLFSLNAVIAAARLNRTGATLSAVAHLMRERSGEISDLLHTLSRDMLSATRSQGDVEFAVSVVRLQTEMATIYARELQSLQRSGESDLAADRTGTSVRALSGCLASGIPSLIGMLEELDGRFAQVRSNVTTLVRELAVLGALHSKGKIEAASGERTDAFHVLLDAIGEKIGAANAEVTELRAAAATCLIAEADTDKLAVHDHHQRIEALAVAA
jgi:PAS domain S-box-containing protein